MRLDLIPVLTVAGDGPVFILHTPEEYERLIAGVDLEAAGLMATDLGAER